MVVMTLFIISFTFYFLFITSRAVVLIWRHLLQPCYLVLCFASYAFFFLDRMHKPKRRGVQSQPHIILPMTLLSITHLNTTNLTHQAYFINHTNLTYHKKLLWIWLGFLQVGLTLWSKCPQCFFQIWNNLLLTSQHCY